eukprot:5446505-Pleurochrysis_carterae.AAC.1
MGCEVRLPARLPARACVRVRARARARACVCSCACACVRVRARARARARAFPAGKRCAPAPRCRSLCISRRGSRRRYNSSALLPSPESDDDGSAGHGDDEKCDTRVCGNVAALVETLSLLMKGGGDHGDIGDDDGVDTGDYKLLRLSLRCCALGKQRGRQE